MKIKIMLFVFLLFICKNMFAVDDNYFQDQDDEKAENISITGYPFPLAIAMLSLEGEYAYNEQFSICIEGKAFYWKLDDGISSVFGENESTKNGEWEVTGLMIGPGVRWYPQKKQMRGFFVGPYIHYARLGLSYTHDSGNGGEGAAQGWNATIWTGYKWIVKRVVVELSTGVSYISMSSLSVKYKNDLGSVQVAEFPVGLSSFYWPGIAIGFGAAF